MLGALMAAVLILTSPVGGMSLNKDDIQGPEMPSDGNSTESDAIPEIHKAIKEGSALLVKALLAKGADIKIRDRSGDQPLVAAIRGKQTAIVEILLDGGADVNAEDIMGFTPLYLAIEKDDPVLVELLLKKGANVNTHMPLMQAAALGNIKIIKMLLANGASVNAVTMIGRNAAFVAVEEGNRILLNELVKQDADVHIRLQSGVTTLMVAAEKGDKAIIELLLKKNVSLDARMIATEYEKSDKDGFTALMLAYGRGQKDVVRLLQRAGAGITAAEKKKAKDWSIRYNVRSLPAFLESAYAEARKLIKKDPAYVVDSMVKLPAFRRDIKRHYGRGMTFVKGNLTAKGGAIIIQIDMLKGVSPRLVTLPLGGPYQGKVDFQGKVTAPELKVDALNEAVAKGEKAEVEELLEKGLDVNFVGKIDMSPLFVSLWIGKNPKITRLLIEKGADVNARAEKDVTPLMIAIEDGNQEIVRLMIDRGTDVNARAVYGATPLFFAVINEKVDIARLLLQRGADVHARLDEDADEAKISKWEKNLAPGDNLLVLAMKKGNKEIVDLLRSAGAKVSPQEDRGVYYSRTNGFIRELKLNLKEAYKASIIYFSEHPEKIVTDIQQLADVGYRPSPEITVVRVNLKKVEMLSNKNGKEETKESDSKIKLKPEDWGSSYNIEGELIMRHAKLGKENSTDVTGTEGEGRANAKGGISVPKLKISASDEEILNRKRLQDVRGLWKDEKVILSIDGDRCLIRESKGEKWEGKVMTIGKVVCNGDNWIADLLVEGKKVGNLIFDDEGLSMKLDDEMVTVYEHLKGDRGKVASAERKGQNPDFAGEWKSQIGTILTSDGSRFVVKSVPGADTQWVGKTAMENIRREGDKWVADVAFMGPDDDGVLQLKKWLHAELTWDGDNLMRNIKSSISISLTKVSVSDGYVGGLIIDARCMGTRPSKSQTIIDEKGRIVYGSQVCARDLTSGREIIFYGSNLKSALSNYRFAVNPIIVLAVKKTGKGDADIVISNADAERIRKLDSKSGFLKNCNVGIILGK